jgi:hypothetical protein
MAQMGHDSERAALTYQHEAARALKDGRPVSVLFLGAGKKILVL